MSLGIVHWAELSSSLARVRMGLENTTPAFPLTANNPAHLESKERERSWVKHRFYGSRHPNRKSNLNRHTNTVY